MIKDNHSAHAYSEIIAHYNNDAEALSRRYESLRFETVHAGILRYLPKSTGRAIDIGAGSGRDAAALCRLGFEVTAVEPSQKMRERGARLHAEDNIMWVDDALPHLRSIERNLQFHLVLVSAVWMHLNRQDQKDAMQTIFDLTVPGGRAFISFRSVRPHDKTIFYPTKMEDVREDATRCGYILLHGGTSEDLLGRSNSIWYSLVLEK